MNQVPLCVDLDGTLIRSDLLYESLFALVRDKPQLVAQVPIQFFKGKAALKRWLLEQVSISVEALPYNQDVLAWLRDQKAGGRTLVLATASDGIVADRIAAHLGIFDLTLSSDGNTNLKGVQKLAALKARYGLTFDYAGNSSADLPIWRECRQAILVDTPASVSSQARRNGNVTLAFDSRKPVLQCLVRELRLHQWFKNLLVCVPLIASHRLTDPQLIGRAALAFLAFGLVASSVYVLNDLVDLESDRRHAVKCKRPLASGDLPLSYALLLGPSLLISGFALASVLPPTASVVLLAYFVLTSLYSYWLKRKLLIDVFTLAALYTIRLVMGGVSYQVELSVWLMSFSMFLFLSLGFAKRAAELYNAREAAVLNSRRPYTPLDFSQISMFGVAAGVASSLVLTLYTHSEGVRDLYRTPGILWLLFPLMLYWVNRIWIITSRGQMDEDPVLFAIKDRVTMLVVVLVLAVLFLATRHWPFSF